MGLYKTGFIEFIVMLVSVLQLWFALLGMFRWNRGFAQDLMNLDAENAERTAPFGRYLALHCALFAALLIWSTLLAQNPDNQIVPQVGFTVRKYVLYCIAVQGLFGGIVVNRKLFALQALPAMVAIGVSYWL